jgi:tetratricopeptide (TPR) repeat protein
VGVSGASDAIRIFLSMLMVVAGAGLAAADEAAQSAVTTRDQLITIAGQLNFYGERDGANGLWQQLRLLDEGDPAAPVGEVETAYWNMMYDENDLRWDGFIRQRCAEAIALAEQRLAQDPDDAEAHYHVGRAMMHLARINGVRGSYMAAGKVGEEGRVHLERALELRPDWTDPKYQLGVYYYFASMLPGLVKWASFLWFIPTGDRETGLAYLDEVANNPGAHRDEARMLLMVVRNYHEPLDPEGALEFATDLHQRYPDNPLIHFELLEVLFSNGEWAGVEQEAMQLEKARVRDPRAEGRQRMARIWRARVLLQTGRTDQAWALIAPMRDDDPTLPSWGLHWLRLTRGQILDVQGQRDGAVAEYEAVLEYAPEDNERSRAFAQMGLSAPFDPAEHSPRPDVAAAGGR